MVLTASCRSIDNVVTSLRKNVILVMTPSCRSHENYFTILSKRHQYKTQSLSVCFRCNFLMNFLQHKDEFRASWR
jgi:hypothetical protein